VVSREARPVSFASAIVASAVVAACSFVVPIDDYRKGPAGSNDASTAAADADVNEGFEGSEPGCGARWGPEQASVERVAEGRTGAACRICRAVTSSVYMIINDQLWRPEPIAGQLYRFEGWLRTARGSPEQAAVEVVYEVSGESEPRVARALARPIPTTWTRVEATLTVPDGATSLRFRVKAGSPVFDSCIDVDDVSITRGM
jgi:hypothetical protein